MRRLVLLIGLLLVPAVALAKGKPAPPPVKAAPTPKPPTEAERLAEQAQEHYKNGDFAGAIGLYKRAHDLTPIGTILYNIAHIYEKKLNERKLAEEYYRRFLAAPDAPPDYVEKANLRLAALKLAAEEEAKAPPPQPPVAPPVPAPLPAPAPVAPPPPVDGDPEGGRRTAMRAGGAVLLVVGVLGIGGGAAAGLIAMDKNNQAAALCVGSSCSDARALTLTSEAFTAANISTAAFVVGGVAAVVGVVVLALAPKARAAHALLSPSVGPGQVGLVLSGAWR